MLLIKSIVYMVRGKDMKPYEELQAIIAKQEEEIMCLKADKECLIERHDYYVDWCEELKSILKAMSALTTLAERR